MLFFTYN